MEQQTSIEAYKELQLSGRLGKLQLKVYNYIYQHPNDSQGECADFLGLERVSINPRYAELYNLGLIISVGKRPCRTTGKKVMTWKAIPERKIKIIQCHFCKQVIRKDAINDYKDSLQKYGDL